MGSCSDLVGGSQTNEVRLPKIGFDYLLVTVTPFTYHSVNGRTQP